MKFGASRSLFWEEAESIKKSHSFSEGGIKATDTLNNWGGLLNRITEA